MKAIKNLEKFKETLPYASEVFGTYTPLIGWKSKRIIDRYNSVINDNNLIDNLKQHFTGIADLVQGQDCIVQIGEITKFTLLPQNNKFLSKIAKQLAKKKEVLLTKDDWYTIFTEDFVKTTLSSICSEISTELTAELGKIHDSNSSFNSPDGAKEYYTNILQEESKVAGVIQYLIVNNKIDELNKVFYDNLEIDNSDKIKKTLNGINKDINDPFLNFNPNDLEEINNKVSLSPVGIVHLFRQYFFEFDTFLGTPVGHVWLAPKSTVEVIETSSRKTTTERTFETVLESINKTENSTTEQDDLSNAVKDDNKNDIKLGVTASAGSGDLQGKVVNKWNASTSLNYDTSHQIAKEDTHKRLKLQSQKLSSEIRQNFKSTFKTITEVTDTNSKRYVIAAADDQKVVVNYELRRKMRQVGVQVQDIGSYLCWQTFVDNPGENLGLANLVHIAKSSDSQINSEPQKIPVPQPKLVEVPGSVDWFQGITKITTITIVPESGYKLKEAEPTPNGINNDGGVAFKEGKGGLSVRVDRKYVDKNPDGNSNLEGPVIVDIWKVSGTQPDGEMPYRITYILEPTQKHIEEINAANTKIITNYNDLNAKTAKTALIEAAKERIKFASEIKTRQYEDLREEERMIIYRKLIRTLLGDLGNNIEFLLFDGENKKAHILSELIQSIFDIDKMLYFVAPEWWRPKIWVNTKHLFKFGFKSEKINDWQDIPDRDSNYFITEASTPARMGSSLGWLLQLDGDKLRNAFLNAPWVKATMPIRPGKEKAALLWLKHVEDSVGLEALYNLDSISDVEKQELRKRYPAPHNITIEDALMYLCEKVEEKHRMEIDGVPNDDDEVPNDDNTITPNPVEKVYQFGFKPLQGGFIAKGKPFEVFDQWIEVLPTDQIAAVQVEYNPITGMQI